MSTRYRKELQDHERELSSTVKSVFHWGLFFAPVDCLSSWSRGSWWSSSRRTQSSHQAYKKISIWRPPIDCGALRSFTDSTISASSIHNVASERKLEQEHTSLEARFPTLECRGIGELIEMHFRNLIPWLFNHANLQRSSVCLRGRIPKLKTSLQISVQVLQSFESFFPTHPFGQQVFLCSETQVRYVYLQDFLQFRNELLFIRCK